MDNVALNYNFLGGIDEDWFVTIHVCIEHAANKAIQSASNIALKTETSDCDEKVLLDELTSIKEAMLEVNHIFRKMPEKCDPYIYYHRVRPYIFGWKTILPFQMVLYMNLVLMKNHSYLEARLELKVL